MEQKRIGIISRYYRNSNCGGLLQAFAMCVVLRQLGFDAEQICYDDSVAYQLAVANEDHPRERPLFVKVLSIIRQDGMLGIVPRILEKMDEKRFRRRKIDIAIPEDVFRKFADGIPHSARFYTNEDIVNVGNDYDAYVVGSDQVWNWAINWFFTLPANHFEFPQPLDVTLLRFVSDGKPRIAYAASLSCPYIPDGLKDLYFSSISRFDAISIREKDSLSLFPPQLKDRIRVVEDPTLLLSSNEWRDLLDIRPEKDGTIFCYFLGGEVKDGKSAKRISKILGMPISAATYACNYGHVDIEYHDMGPREFVQHIMNASLVLTNSFHASLFSIQFHTPFYVFDRKWAVSMTSRLTSLLSDYGLQDRMITHDFDKRKIRSSYSDIDWSRVDEIIKKRREYSIDFLKTSLKDVGLYSDRGEDD